MLLLFMFSILFVCMHTNNNYEYFRHSEEMIQKLETAGLGFFNHPRERLGKAINVIILAFLL